MKDDRWVLHIDMDAFYASVEQLTRPTLRNRPVLVGGISGRGVVAGASYEARAFGARSAMPIIQAKRLVGPHAVIVPPRGKVYGVASKKVFAAIRELVPVLEMLSIDEGFGEPIQLRGASAAEVTHFASHLRAYVKMCTGLTASVGLGTSKQMAKIASGLAKPDGVKVISPVEQIALLHSLSVRKISGIGPVAQERLHRIGVESVGQLAAMSHRELANIFGESMASALERAAWAIDHRPVVQRATSKQVSAERTFAADLTTLTQIRAAIDSSAAMALTRLEKDGRGARTVTVKLKKTDMSVVSRSMTVPTATTDPAQLTAMAQQMAVDPLEFGAVRLVGVGFSGLGHIDQYPLFESNIPNAEDLGMRGIAHCDGLETAQITSVTAPAVHTDQSRPGWRTGMDVSHEDFGHGWVQGAGHGRVTVRFETRSTGPGRARTFDASDAALALADPLASLDWKLSPSSQFDEAETVTEGGDQGAVS